MNQPDLLVGVEERIDSEALDGLKESLAYFTDDVRVEVVPNPGPKASILLLDITPIVLMFSAGFFTKYGQLTDSNSTPKIIQSLESIYAKYFGVNPKIRMEVVASQHASKKVNPTKYSLILSLVCVGIDNQHVKFLYETNWSNREYDTATEEYLKAIAEYTATGVGRVSDLIDDFGRKERTFLVAWDATDQRLISVDWRVKE